MSKRKRPDQKPLTNGLNEHESKIYEVIRSKQGMCASKAEMRSATNIIDTIITRSIKSLMSKNLIKEVQNSNNIGLKLYMGIEFKPSTEITGGVWYTDGALDVSFIEKLKEICVKFLTKKRGAVTLDDIYEFIGKASLVKLSKEQVEEIVKNLILDNVVMEVISNGMNEFSMMKMGEICYKLTGKKSGDNNGDMRIGAFAGVPCGVCPRIGDCSPDGIISPNSCVYFQKWLDF